MAIYDIQDQFASLHQWLKKEYKLAEPTLSQVAASLVQSNVVAFANQNQNGRSSRNWIYQF